ncbi:MAG: hypothetical protein H6Q14_2992 [Bacteroidetes bacterium]|nr:hypothetical protein [Bacteroidota bacterium]
MNSLYINYKNIKELKADRVRIEQMFTYVKEKNNS